MTASRFRRDGFTIVELLVVISVMAVLLGLLLPALSGARKKGLKADELSKIRQLGVAWNLYAQSNRDAALPGFLDGRNPGPGGVTVQVRWRVRYEYANGDPALPGDAEEWPWRLLPYLDFNHDLVLGHLDLDDTSSQAMSDTTLMDPVPHRGAGTEIPRTTHVAEEPSFAYNAFYVGGWYDQWLAIRDEDNTIVGHTPRPRYGGKVTVLDVNGEPLTYDINSDSGTETFDLKTDPIVRSPAQIRNGSNLILFCSASRVPIGEIHEVEPNRFGSHVVVPPYLADTPMWRKSLATPSDTTIEVRNMLDQNDAPVPIGRHTGAAATLRADLHTDASTVGALDDQRLWIDAADRKLWIHGQD